MADQYLAQTRLLDYQHADIAALILRRGWQALEGDHATIGAAYDFVRDEIAFGYNRADDIKASAVLADGYGQCNTKATLLMALLRALGVRCRLRAATIHKRLQRGAVSGVWYWLAPREIIHTWAEVLVDGRWTGLEGVILDKPYIAAVQAAVGAGGGPFTGYAIATQDIAHPAVDWNGGATQIQAEGIVREFGVFESPDAFYARHGTNLSPVQRVLYGAIVRHRLNRTVCAIRTGRSGG